jgi:predicted alpha/beta-fold hydrolase
VPALVLYAANDPFIRITVETRRKIASNKNITFVETQDGGHCAFVGAPDGAPRSANGVGNDSGDRYSDDQYDDGFWAEHEIVNFLRRF